MKKRAFTLIELLIVVAIIGILAAIAIPNFLEAQTRAKVSRTVADQRTIAMAIETFMVDHNCVPRNDSTPYDPCGNPDNRTFQVSYLWVQDAQTGLTGRVLTSPIAYLSSIPADLFNSKINPDPNLPPTPIENPPRSTMLCTTFPDTYVGRSHWTDWWRQYLSGDPGNEAYVPLDWHWMLQSVGPSVQWSAVPYDPTNGTVSIGMIWRYSTGHTFPAK